MTVTHIGRARPTSHVGVSGLGTAFCALPCLQLEAAPLPHIYSCSLRRNRNHTECDAHATVVQEISPKCLCQPDMNISCTILHPQRPAAMPPCCVSRYMITAISKPIHYQVACPPMPPHIHTHNPFQAMLAPVRLAAVTGPALVIMGCPLYPATRSALVLRSGMTASHSFFFCTRLGSAGAAWGEVQVCEGQGGRGAGRSSVSISIRKVQKLTSDEPSGHVLGMA
jgi:hypothetical protein